MIPMKELESTAKALEAEYDKVIKPLLKRFGREFTEIWSQFDNSSLRNVCKEHGIKVEFPTRFFYENGCGSLKYYTSDNGTPHISIATFCGYHSSFSLWEVASSCGERTGNPSAIANFLVSVKKKFNEVVREYEEFWAKKTARKFAEYVAERVNRVREAERMDDAEFRELFGKASAPRKIKITILVEED